MAGRRLVDVAKLFNASKTVARQHIKLRSQQLDVYGKTSTLAKAAKDQTDRITVTIEAAVALSKRLNEEAPRYASAAAQRATGARHADIPRQETLRADRAKTSAEEGLEQDHHYNRSGGNTKADPPTEEDLHVQQEQPDQRPLPDGTIPSAGVTLDGYPHQPSTDGRPGVQQNPNAIPSHANEPYRPPPSGPVQKLQDGRDRDVFYARSVESQPAPPSSPQTQIPKNTEATQESDHHVRDGGLNQDVFYSVPEPAQEQVQTEEIPHKVAVPEQDDVPEGINTDVFRTKRVARMLGGNPYKQKDRLGLEGAATTPYDRTKIADGHDQDTFNVRKSEQGKPSIPEEPLQPAQPAHTEPEPELTTNVDAASTSEPAVHHPSCCAF